jgi:hypothetical protein
VVVDVSRDAVSCSVDPFISVWSTAEVASRHLIGADGRVEFTLDGLTFRRTRSGAAARGTRRTHQVDWANITQAELATSRKGKPVFRIGISGGAPVDTGPRRDPHALKVKRSRFEEARAFVDPVNAEIAARRRWRKT